MLEKRYLNLEKARTAYNDAYEINEGLTSLGKDVPIYNISTKTLKAVRELDPCLDLKTTETLGTLEQINLLTILTRLNTKFIHQREQFMDTMLVMGLDTKHSFDMVSYLKTAFFEDDKIDLSVVVDLSTLIDDDKEFITEIYDMLHDIREEYTAAWGHVEELQAEAEKAYVLDGVENTMTRLWGDRPAPSEFT